MLIALATVSVAISSPALSLIGVLRRAKQSAPLPFALHSNLGCLLFVTGSSYSGTTLLAGDSVGEAAPALLKLAKCRRAL